MIAMSIYTAFMLIAWPLASETTSLPLKILLAVAPTVPVLYVIGQMARLILNSDELERHTHLVALGTATAVVSALSIVAGFLASAGVVKLDGSSLLFVFPAMVVCYALVRWWVMRSYAGSGSCEEGFSIKPSVFMMLGGVALLLAALLLKHHAQADRLTALSGVGFGFMAGGLLPVLLRWFKRKYRRE
ncbi:hypothetical protein GCM10007898_31220 [Dyella flagellata]|uniref:Uncharacterized protein n=2 Tax=Dyella flagellata TaxID=1867833 RepID=A0ABQ5XG61_9GAMM|nr:hypothetical protein GCM10007898_31220 [Dyella flagellata]